MSVTTSTTAFVAAVAFLVTIVMTTCIGTSALLTETQRRQACAVIAEEQGGVLRFLVGVASNVNPNKYTLSLEDINGDHFPDEFKGESSSGPDVRIRIPSLVRFISDLDCAGLDREEDVHHHQQVAVVPPPPPPPPMRCVELKDMERLVASASTTCPTCDECAPPQPCPTCPSPPPPSCRLDTTCAECETNLLRLSDTCERNVAIMRETVSLVGKMRGPDRQNRSVVPFESTACDNTYQYATGVLGFVSVTTLLVCGWLHRLNLRATRNLVASKPKSEDKSTETHQPKSKTAGNCKVIRHGNEITSVTSCNNVKFEETTV